ncbi:MAG: tetratricopeptide repeat protein, partial [Planctomycetia bacterium]|nr:tetratricopeptide repeat protein [Planctomycetia bacterium]
MTVRFCNNTSQAISFDTHGTINVYLESVDVNNLLGVAECVTESQKIHLRRNVVARYTFELPLNDTDILPRFDATKGTTPLVVSLSEPDVTLELIEYGKDPNDANSAIAQNTAEPFNVFVATSKGVRMFEIRTLDAPVTVGEALAEVTKHCKKVRIPDAIQTEFVLNEDGTFSTLNGVDCVAKADAPTYLVAKYVHADETIEPISDWKALTSRTPQSGDKIIFCLLDSSVLTRCLPFDSPAGVILREYRTQLKRMEKNGLIPKTIWRANASKTEEVYVKYIREVAKQGDAETQYNWGGRYYRGDGVTQNYAEAVKWYRMAAEQGHIGAQYNLGECYANGDGVSQDYAEAAKWYRKAAEQGDALAQVMLGAYYVTGTGVLQDYAEAAKWYRKAAEQDDARGQYSLGMCYYKGVGAPQNYVEAVRWFRKAAEQDDARGQYNLGVCYARGEGVLQDYAEAAKWYRKAAEQGDAGGQYNLGECYANGDGVSQDRTEAAKWYRKAAEQGNAGGQYKLGMCYYNGVGVPQNYVEAAKWYRKAAEQGEALAQVMLGICYYTGTGVLQDYAEAAKWYRKAAEQGNAGGQY